MSVAPPPPPAASLCLLPTFALPPPFHPPAGFVAVENVPFPPIYKNNCVSFFNSIKPCVYPP